MPLGKKLLPYRLHLWSLDQPPDLRLRLVRNILVAVKIESSDCAVAAAADALDKRLRPGVADGIRTKIQSLQRCVLLQRKGQLFRP